MADVCFGIKLVSEILNVEVLSDWLDNAHVFFSCLLELFFEVGLVDSRFDVHGF